MICDGGQVSVAKRFYMDIQDEQDEDWGMGRGARYLVSERYPCGEGRLERGKRDFTTDFH
jgi:hypothetical protein